MLVAFSHLRWGFVRQRPQHLLSRFARQMRVIFVEEPEFEFAHDHLQARQDGQVSVVTPRLAGRSHIGGFGTEVNSRIATLLDTFLPIGTDVHFWYYTPMAIGAEPTSCHPVLRIYDAMDDLAGFLNAPPELASYQTRLLALVDLVFSGGPTLYRSLRDRHPAAHCFPSGVEPAHFAQCLTAAPHRDLAHQPQPVLGYFGVVDERLDLQLLADIADLRPDWTIALVGPVAKISERSIPTRANILRLGQRDYTELPAILAGFDVAMMPFARNDATRSISPTKTLEYLAGGKPVVSTPIADVLDLYADFVEIAETGEGFVAAAESLMVSSAEATCLRNQMAGRVVAANDWDVIATRMLDLMAHSRVRTLAVPVLEPVALTA